MRDKETKGQRKDKVAMKESQKEDEQNLKMHSDKWPINDAHHIK